MKTNDREFQAPSIPVVSRPPMLLSLPTSEALIRRAPGNTTNIRYYPAPEKPDRIKSIHATWALTASPDHTCRLNQLWNLCLNLARADCDKIARLKTRIVRETCYCEDLQHGPGQSGATRYPVMTWPEIPGKTCRAKPASNSGDYLPESFPFSRISSRSTF